MKKYNLTQNELNAIIADAVAQALAKKAPKGKGKAKPEPKAIAFTLEGKTATADRYMCRSLYARNKALAESLDGTLTKGAKTFTAEFKTATKAKAFMSKAVTAISAEEYAADAAERKANAENHSVSKAEKSKANKALAADLRKKLGREFTAEEWAKAKAGK